jgi:hypothetical protein
MEVREDRCGFVLGPDLLAERGGRRRGAFDEAFVEHVPVFDEDSVNVAISTDASGEAFDDDAVVTD